jgi:hypothetical protein
MASRPLPSKTGGDNPPDEAIFIALSSIIGESTRSLETVRASEVMSL